MPKNNIYTDEFKSMIVDLYKSKVKTPKTISEEYNIPIANIYAWARVEKVKNHKNTTYTPEQLELIELKEKLKIKEMENEILKKSIAIFCQTDKKQ